MLGSELLRLNRGVRLRSTLPLVAGTVAAIVTTSALAQEKVKIEPIVVTASGHEQEVKDAPASISVITREELESQQYQNITDALRDVPGVIVTGGGSGDNGADISIRGMSSSYTLILVNGQRVDTRESRPNGSAGFEQNWLPPLQAIERIEVVRGPMSTLYGSDAIGGVINVITRKVPQKLEGAIQADGLLQQDSASGNAYQSNFYLASPLSEDLLGLQLYGQYSTREEDDILNGYEDREHKTVTARLTLTPTPDHDLTLEAGVSEQHREGTVGKTVATSGCRGGCVDSDNTYTETHFSLAHAGRLSFGNIDSHIKREISDNQGRDIEITNTTAKTSLWIPFGDHLVTVGGNYGLEELDDATTNRISDRTQVDMIQYAAFAEDEWLVLPDVSLTGGLRMDFNEDYGANLSPRLYGNWNISENWTLKGGVSSGYRSPNLREITPDWGQVSRGGNVYGNPDLEPETSLSKEIGVIYSGRSGIEASVTVFHNAFKDKITRITCPTTICTDGPNQFGSDPTYRVNIDEAETQGIEVSLAGDLSDTVSLSGSYTLTQSEQLSGDYKGEPLTQLPEHQATAQVDWRATPQLRPWARVTFRGEESQPTTGPSSSSTVAPSYTFLDIGVSYDLSENVQVNLAGYNLTDKRITYDEYGYVEDGRRVWFSMTAKF